MCIKRNYMELQLAMFMIIEQENFQETSNIFHLNWIISIYRVFFSKLSMTRME